MQTKKSGYKRPDLKLKFSVHGVNFFYNKYMNTIEQESLQNQIQTLSLAYVKTTKHITDIIHPLSQNRALSMI